MTDLKEVLKPYFEMHDDKFGKYMAEPNRYEIRIECTIFKKSIGIFKSALAKLKFSGRTGSIKNIGTQTVFKIDVYDRTSASSNSIETSDIAWEYMQKSADLELLDKYLEDISDTLKTERSVASILASKEELLLKGKIAEATTSDLTLPATIGKYSQVDKEFFKWFAVDNSGNKYLYCKDNSVVRIPIIGESGASERVRAGDTKFWTTLWRNYGEELMAMIKNAEKVLWELYTKETQSVEQNEIRTAPIISEDGDISAKQKVHEVLPKFIMNRACARFTRVSEDKDEGSYLVSINVFVRESTKSGTWLTPSEENLFGTLSSVIPILDESELQCVARYADNPYGAAIHRIQTAMWKQNLPEKISEVGHLPPTWSKFFETRLGNQKFSMMYRIAKWLVGTTDAKDFSRKVLVISGHGSDGKSLFQNAVMAGLNKLSNTNMCSVLPAEAVTIEGNTQNGLADCLDARAIMVSDVTRVTDFLKSDVIKAITGGDVITCNIKYCAPIKKDMSGTKIMLCTNAKTYLSDTFVDSRVSPVYFERHDNGEGDWNPREIKAQLVDEFADFMKWCHRYAYAVECERGIPHDGDQPIWSDGIDKENIKDAWEVIGTENGGDSMFVYRRLDEESEGEEADLWDVCEDLFEPAKDNKVRYKEVIPVLKAYCKEKDIRTFNFDKQKYKVMLLKVLQRKFDNVDKFISHGQRGFIGIKLKEDVGESSRGKHYKRIDSGTETQIPF